MESKSETSGIPGAAPAINPVGVNAPADVPKRRGRPKGSKSISSDKPETGKGRKGGKKSAGSVKTKTRGMFYRYCYEDDTDGSCTYSECIPIPGNPKTKKAWRSAICEIAAAPDRAKDFDNAKVQVVAMAIKDTFSAVRKTVVEATE